MTVLLLKHEKDKIILGADTGIFYGNYHVKDLKDHKLQTKIYQVNDIVFADTGVCSESCNFALFCSTRKPESATTLGIQRFMVDFGKYLKDMNLSEKVQNFYFIVFQKRAFHFQLGATEEILEGDYETDGCGFKEAYMALYLGKSPKEAIELTIKMNSYVSGSPQIVEIEK